MFFAVELKIGSHAVIGIPFGKDHATVLHACKAINNYYLTDRLKRERIDEYREKLTGVKKALEMVDVFKKEMLPLKAEIAESEKRLVNLRLSLDNLETFIEKLML
jgi:hypothetical protein